jgi:hypothetical protein
MRRDVERVQRRVHRERSLAAACRALRASARSLKGALDLLGLLGRKPVYGHVGTSPRGSGGKRHKSP